MDSNGAQLTNIASGLTAKVGPYDVNIEVDDSSKRIIVDDANVIQLLEDGNSYVTSFRITRTGSRELVLVNRMSDILFLPSSGSIDLGDSLSMTLPLTSALETMRSSRPPFPMKARDGQPCPESMP